MAEERMDFPYAGNGVRQDTPVGRLIAGWRAESPRAHQLAAARAALYLACSEEIREMMEKSIDYDPSRDYRVRWAHRYLACLADLSVHMDPGLQATVDFLFGDPPPPSAKHRAAHDL